MAENKYIVRMPTGGISAADATAGNSEWDQYIVNSPLGNGNDIWNWNGVSTWTSTVPTTSNGSNPFSSVRVGRGKESFSQFTNTVLTSYVNATAGFRPVLEIESLFTPIKRSFLSVSDGYKKLKAGSPEIPAKYGDNAIPQMTSNTSPSGIVSASSFAGAGAEAWLAFDKKTNEWATASGVTTGWISYQFPIRKTISSYTIAGSGTVKYSPKDWTFEGSNDGVNWNVLDTQKSFVDWTPREIKKFNTNNNNAYLIYRINITANNGDGTFLMLVEIEMMESITLATPTTPPSWQTVSPTLPTLTQFQEEGMDDFSALDRKVQTVMESPIAMTSEVLGAGEVLKATVNLNKYFDLRKLEVK